MIPGFLIGLGVLSAISVAGGTLFVWGFRKVVVAYVVTKAVQRSQGLRGLERVPRGAPRKPPAPAKPAKPELPPLTQVQVETVSALRNWGARKEEAETLVREKVTPGMDIVQATAAVLRRNP